MNRNAYQIAGSTAGRFSAIAQQGSLLKQNLNFAIADGSKTLDIELKFPIGNVVTVHWGDNTTTDYNGNDDVGVTLSKSYAEPGSYQIKFSGDFNTITSIDAFENNLTGDMSGLSALTSLTYLKLGVNSFTGDMSSLSALTSLTNLLLANNSFTGDMSSLSALTSLIELNLGLNSFTGDMSGLSALTSLTYLRLTDNSFTGDMSSLSALTSLTSLDISINSFTNIPVIGVKDILVYNVSKNSVSTSNIDYFLSALNTYYSANAPTKNCTYTLNGTGMGIPTGGASNSDLLAVVNAYSSAGKTATFVINT